MLKDYYYTDKEELDALRKENAKLVQEVEDLKRQVAKLTKSRQKSNGGEANGNKEN